MSQRRNEPCSCGSGRKYKNCCENNPIRTDWTRYAAGGALALIVAVGLVMAIMDWADHEPGPPIPAPPGKVWSTEHGHWHDAATPPPGETAPPGQVWSAEHGHFHDAPDGTAQGGEAPPGKVWSEEHGHYHDAPAGAAAGGTPPPGPAPPGKVWSAEHGHWHDAPAGTPPPPADPLDDFGTSPAPTSEAPADANG